MFFYFYVAPVVDFVAVPAIVPRPPEPSGGGEAPAAEPNSFMVAFDITPELEVNGPVDK